MRFIRIVLSLLGEKEAKEIEDKLNVIIRRLKSTISDKDIKIKTLEEQLLEQEKRHIDLISEINIKLGKLDDQLKKTNENYETLTNKYIFESDYTKALERRLTKILDKYPDIKLSEINRDLDEDN